MSAHLDSTLFTWRGQTVKLSPAPGGYFVYLLHFHSRYYHAGHYTGMTANLDARLTLHRTGRGARLMKAITEAGISFEVARLWKCETWEEARALEKALKARHDGARNCPVCQGKPLDALTSLRRGHHPAVSRPQGKRRPMRECRSAFVHR